MFLNDSNILGSLLLARVVSVWGLSGPTRTVTFGMSIGRQSVDADTSWRLLGHKLTGVLHIMVL